MKVIYKIKPTMISYNVFCKISTSLWISDANLRHFFNSPPFLFAHLAKDV